MDFLARELQKAERKQRGKHGGRGFIEEAKHQREGVRARDRARRHRAPTEGHVLHESLGKTTSVHQVLPADQSTRTANNPRTDFGKAVLSGTGGHPRMVSNAKTISSQVLQVSPHHAKKIMRAGNSLKYTPHAKSLISH